MTSENVRGSSHQKAQGLTKASSNEPANSKTSVAFIGGPQQSLMEVWVWGACIRAPNQAYAYES